MADEKIIIEVDLEAPGSSKVFKKIEGEAEESGSRIGKLLSANIGGGIAVAAKAATAAFAAFAGGLGVAARAASVQQQAVNELNSSLAQIGEFSKETSKDLQDFAASIEETTKFGDEAVLSQLAFAQQMGATAEQSKAILLAATDLATALNIDLNSAVRNISKTMGGYGGELSEVLPGLKNFTQEQLRAGAAIDFIGEKFRGLAQRDTQTFSGALTQLGNTFGTLLENIGNFVVQSPLVAKAIQLANKFINDLAKSIAQVDVQGFTKRAVTSFVAFGNSVNDFLIKPIELLSNIGRVVFNAIVMQLNSIVAAVGQVGKGLASVLNFAGIENSVTEGLQNFGETSLSVFNESFEDFEAAKNRVFDFPTALKTEQALVELQEFSDQAADPMEAITEQFEMANQKIGTETKGISKSVKKAAFDTDKAFSQVAAQGVSTGIESITQSLIKGQFNFSVFAKGVLGVIADMIIQIGKSAIATGIAIEAIGKLSGTAAIIAGAGLIALGSIIKSFVGGSEGGLSTAPSGGFAGGAGSGNIAAPDDFTTEVAEPDAVQNQQQVQVVVNGDVFDTEETGLRLVNILKENFEQEGTTIAV